MIKVAKGMDDVRAALGDVEPLHLPSADQFNFWRDWVRWSDGCDTNGAFIGTCPMCRTVLAWYNFNRGTFECSEACCHEGKRGMTLVALVSAVARRALNG